MISTWCDRMIVAGFYLLFIFVPLILTPWNYELFEYNKMMLVYGLTTVIVGAWIIRMVNGREVRIARTPLDIPLLLFFLSQLVSALFSIDRHVSWFGYYSRFNGGMWSITSYILLYYAFVSHLANSSNLTKLLKVSLTTAIVVALYGVAERLGVDKHLWVQDVQNRVFSTLGQPNWLAAYLVALSPIAWGFALKIQNSKFKIQNYFWMGISVLFFIVLLFTRSRSGLLGLAVSDVVFWGLLFLRSRLGLKVPQGLALPFIICHGSFVIVVLLNGTSINSIDRWFRPQSPSSATSVATPSGYAAPLLEYGGTESGTIRKYVWQGAITAWKGTTKTFLVGTGTETFAFAFYQFRPREHNLTSEWDFLYNKAHNEYLNYLTTTGVFGLGSYLLIIGTFVIWFFKVQMNVKTQRSNDIWMLAVFAGWASVLVTNFFGFSIVLVQLIFFLFPAMIISADTQNQAYNVGQFKLSGAKIRAGSFVILGVAVIFLFFLVRLWWADTLFATGYRSSRAGLYGQAHVALSRAITINPGEPFYHDEDATTLSNFAIQTLELRDATSAATLAKKSIEESDIATSMSPNNVNYWKSRTKIFYTFSSFDPVFNKAAIQSLERAQTLSPNDPKIPYNVAILYGREGDNQKAIDLLKATIDLKPNYRDAYWALSIFYIEIKQPQLAKSTLQEYLTRVDPNDSEFFSKVGQL